MPKEVDNGILVIYEYDEKYKNYMDILKGCFDNIAMINLDLIIQMHIIQEFLLMNQEIYYLSLSKENVEMSQMQGDINEILLGMLKGNVLC